MKSDIHDWNITFVDTGISSNIGQRLKAVRPYLEGKSVFLANYSDGLTDLPLSEYIDCFFRRDKFGSFLAVSPSQSCHVASFNGDVVTAVHPIVKAVLWINGGFFVFRQEIFRYTRDGEELVEQPFQRLIQEGRLIGYKYNGYWSCMDTFKERQQLDGPLQSRRRLLGGVEVSQERPGRELARGAEGHQEKERPHQ